MGSLTSERRKEFLALCDAATQGKWTVLRLEETYGTFLFITLDGEEMSICDVDSVEDAAYIAATGPNVVRELIQENETLHRYLALYLNQGAFED